MADFLMSAGRKRAMLAPHELASALSDFLICFEAVFGDADWDMTLDILTGDGLKHYIRPSGTFLDPGVEDESNNWGNRGALLASYRRLTAILAGRNFNIVELCPCGVATKPHPAEAAVADDVI
jgi:hypothetical protein